ncbi:MAG: hypothetical protein KAV00_15310 [Phycisphaerae bacterium]|nr:hypothetical protein [Phycisphaerae bacterium]
MKNKMLISVSLIGSITLRALPWFVFGLGALCAALLPSETLSKAILACSYDGEVENISVFVVLARGLLVGFGLIVFIHSLPAVRRFTLNRVFPKPHDIHVHDVFFSRVDSGRLLLMTGVLVFTCLPLATILAIRPYWAHCLLHEDGLYEIAQAVLYLLSAGLLAAASALALKYNKPVGVVHVVYPLLSLGLFLVGLEEISFGQRAIGFGTPEIIESVNVQDEFNLHNILTGFINRLFACFAFLFGFILPLSGFFFSRLRYLFERFRIELPKGWGILPFGFAAVFVVPIRHHRPVFDEQLALSYVMIASLLVLLLKGLWRNESRGRVWPLFVFIALVVSVKVLLYAFAGCWHNYVEEGREFFIAFGLFCYAVVVFRNQVRLKHQSEQAIFSNGD